MGDHRDGQSVFVCLRKELQGEFDEGLQFPQLSVVEDRLNIIGFLGSWPLPNTSSYVDKFILVLTCELKAK